MADVINPDPAFWSKTSWIQIGYGAWASLTMVGVGLAFNFPAVAIPQMKSPNAPFTLTLSEESWIASILTLVAPIGCVVCGYFMDMYGRKIILMLCEVPMCLGWVYTGFAGTAHDVTVGRVIVGVAIGMATGATRIFITETTLPNMRGAVGVFPNLSMALGLMITAAGGVFLHWTTICYASSVYSFALLCVNILLPETPYFTLLKKTDSAALSSLKKFRSAQYNVEKEMNDMIEFRTVNNLRRLKFTEELKLLLTKSAFKPFIIISIYMLLTQMAGVTIIFTWTVELLQASRSSVDPNVGNLMMGTTRFCTSLLSSILLYKIGRKTQALMSGFGVAIVCIFLGCYLNYGPQEPSMVPQICYVAYVVFATLGYYTLPLLIMYEIYPLQIRGLLGGISTSVLNILIFLVNKYYPYLRNQIGHENVLLCFGVSSLLGCLFLFVYLPETKGLTLQEIEEYFNDRRSTLVSQRSQQAFHMSTSSKIHKMTVKSRDKDLKNTSDEQPTTLQLRKKKKKSDKDHDEKKEDEKKDGGGNKDGGEKNDDKNTSLKINDG